MESFAFFTITVSCPESSKYWPELSSLLKLRK